jgi:hypothetical protein
LIACAGFATGSGGTIELIGAARPVRRGRTPARRRALFGLACALALSPATPAQAFELVSVEASREGDAFQLRIEARFDATPAQLLAVLTDYDRLHELDRRITATRALGLVDADADADADGHAEDVYSSYEACMLVFCRSLHRVERVRVQGHSLLAEDVPDRGSFREGRTHWRLSPRSAGARLEYEAHFVPAFRVPPFIGRALVARFVERVTLSAMAELERRALLQDD